MSPFINPKTRFAFKRIFGLPQGKKSLLSFLSALLYDRNPVIQDIEAIDLPQVPLIEGMKKSSLNVRVKLLGGEAVSIRIQTLNVPGFEKRVMYNAASVLATKLEADRTRTHFNSVIALTITDLEMFPYSDGVISRYQLLGRDRAADCSDGIELVFVELPKFSKHINELETMKDKWLYFLKQANYLESIPTSLQQEPGIRDAFEAALITHLSEKELDIMEGQAMYIHDYRNSLKLAFRKGVQMREMQERQTKKKAIARSLIGKLSPSEISQITGLSLQEIESL